MGDGFTRTARGPLFVRHAVPAAPGLPPTVVVHGLGGASTNWTAFMDAVRDGADVFAPDLPGFGDSPAPVDGDFSLDAHLNAVAALIEALDRGAVHLVGNSLGGAIATRLSAQRPDLVRTLTLISPALPDLVPSRWTAGLLLTLVPGLGAAGTRGFARVPVARRVDMVMRACVADPTRVDRDLIAREVERRAAAPGAEKAFTASLRGLVETYLQRGPRALWREAAQVRVPTLLVYGLCDRLVNPRQAARAVRVFPQARLVEIRDCGHLAQLEQADLVAGAFREFVGAAPASGMAKPRGTVTDGDHRLRSRST